MLGLVIPMKIAAARVDLGFWLFWVKRPFETVFSLYLAVSQRQEEERKDRGE